MAVYIEDGEGWLPEIDLLTDPLKKCRIVLKWFQIEASSIWPHWVYVWMSMHIWLHQLLQGTWWAYTGFKFCMLCGNCIMTSRREALAIRSPPLGGTWGTPARILHQHIGWTGSTQANMSYIISGQETMTGKGESDWLRGSFVESWTSCFKMFEKKKNSSSLETLVVVFHL